MTLWVAVVVASVASLLIKLAGYLVPETLLAGERTSRVTTLLPVALLAALVVVQTVVGPGGSLVLDARIVAVGVGRRAAAAARELPGHRARRRRHRRAAARPGLGLTARPTRPPARRGSGRARSRRSARVGCDRPGDDVGPDSSSRRWKNPGASR